MHSPLVRELAEYTEQPLELVAARCKAAVFELAWLWNETRQDLPIEDFYRKTDLYIFELTNYQQSLLDSGFYSWFLYTLHRLDVGSMLDFGGGIGEYTIQANKTRTRSFFFVELALSETLRYAEWRFHRHGVQPLVLFENDLWWKDRRYDLIVAMDVLEHLADPQPVIARMAECSEYVIANTSSVPYNVFFPQHISKPDMTTHFEKVEHDLWKRKATVA